MSVASLCSLCSGVSSALALARRFLSCSLHRATLCSGVSFALRLALARCSLCCSLHCATPCSYVSYYFIVSLVFNTLRSTCSECTCTSCRLHTQSQCQNHCSTCYCGARSGSSQLVKYNNIRFVENLASNKHTNTYIQTLLVSTCLCGACSLQLRVLPYSSQASTLCSHSWLAEYLFMAGQADLFTCTQVTCILATCIQFLSS